MVYRLDDDSLSRLTPPATFSRQADSSSETGPNEHGYPADRRLHGRSRVTGAGCTGGGVHPAMMRAHSRTRVLSVMACAAEWNRKVA